MNTSKILGKIKKMSLKTKTISVLAMVIVITGLVWGGLHLFGGKTSAAVTKTDSSQEKASDPNQEEASDLALDITEEDGAKFISNIILARFDNEQSARDFAKTNQVELVQYTEVSGIASFQTASKEQFDSVLAENKGELEITPNYVYEAASSQAEVLYPRQWGMQLIDAEYAVGVEDGENATVAVIDSGINPNSGEFDGRIIKKYQACDYSVDSACDPNDTSSTNTHGTHVAGIIAADNTTGQITGVAPNVKLLDIKSSLEDSGGHTTFSLTSAIYYAIENKADVINMSLSGGPKTVDKLYLNAIASAIQQKIVVVAAAGNDGKNAAGNPADSKYPCAFDGVICVGSIELHERKGVVKSDFSNFGNAVDFVAPGTDIYSTVGDGYDYKSGTSMATPFVTGLAALIKSQNPNATVDEAYEKIRASAIDIATLGKDRFYGQGLINVGNIFSSDIKTVTIDYGTDSGKPKVAYKVVAGERIKWLGPQTTELPWGSNWLDQSDGLFKRKTCYAFMDKWDLNSPVNANITLYMKLYFDAIPWNDRACAHSGNVIDSSNAALDLSRSVKSNDATAIQQYLAGLREFTEEQKEAADVNQDKAVSYIDAVIILRHLAHFPGYETLPVAGVNPVPGDANWDGVVNSSDVQLLETSGIFTNFNPTSTQYKWYEWYIADVNQDSRVTEADRSLIQQYLDGKITSLTAPSWKRGDTWAASL